MEVIDEIEKKLQRQKFLMMVDILEGYRSNIHQALSRMETSKQIYRSAHGCYALYWKGQTRDAYEEIASEINHTGNKINQQGEQLIKEIQRLQAEAEALR